MPTLPPMYSSTLHCTARCGTILATPKKRSAQNYVNVDICASTLIKVLPSSHSLYFEASTARSNKLTSGFGW